MCARRRKRENGIGDRPTSRSPSLPEASGTCPRARESHQVSGLGLAFFAAVCAWTDLRGAQAAGGVPLLIGDVNQATSSDPKDFTPVGGVVLFSAHGGLSLGRELFRTDGAPAAARLAIDVWPGPDSGDPRSLTPSGGAVDFSAADGTAGRELWSYDPAADTAARRGDVWPGAASSSPEELTPLGRFLYFSAGDGFNSRGLGEGSTSPSIGKRHTHGLLIVPSQSRRRPQCRSKGGSSRMGWRAAAFSSMSTPRPGFSFT